MKAYKGFNRDMTCNGFQYEEGKEYEMETAKCCNHGFHACLNPFDILNYYPILDNDCKFNKFHEVEVPENIDKGGGDTKFASNKIKIGAEIDIKGLVTAGINFIFENVKESFDKKTNKDDYAQIGSSGDYAKIGSNG